MLKVAQPVNKFRGAERSSLWPLRPTTGQKKTNGWTKKWPRNISRRMEGQYSRTPLIRTLTIRISNYPDRRGRSGKFVKKSTKPACLEITGLRIKYSTVLWLLELQIRPGRKVWTQVHTVNCSSWPSACQCSPFSSKKPIFLIFCISRWLAVPINPEKWSSAVFKKVYFSLRTSWRRTEELRYGSTPSQLWQ